MNSKGFEIFENQDFLSDNLLHKTYEFWRKVAPINPSQKFYANLNIEDLNYKVKSDQFIRENYTEYIQSIYPDYNILFGSFVIKLVGEESRLPLHQDWSFTDETKSRTLNFWIPISDLISTSGNLFT